MARHKLSLLCQLVLTDELTKATSYINIAEDLVLAASGNPFPPLTLATILYSEGDSDYFHLKYSIVDPVGAIVWSKSIGPQVFGNFKRYKIAVEITGGPTVVQAGEYVIQVESIAEGKTEKLADIPVGVTFRS